MIRNKPVPAESFKKINKLQKVFEDFGTIEFAYHFGRSVKGDPGPLSDIDMAVYFEEGCDLSKLKLDLLGKINDFLGTDEVDLVVLNTAPISLVGRIMMQKKLLYSKNDFLRHRYESLTLRKFFDFRLFESRLLARRFNLG